jgi:hypothetical protein
VSITAAAYQARQTEAQFMATVREYAEENGWLVWHFPNAIINPCVPDLFLFRDGVLVLAELKTQRKGSKATVNQVRMILDLSAHGFFCYVWRPSDWPEIERILSMPNATMRES